jgi:lathosterol oxidase
MDVALELVDHFVADGIYAKLMPIAQPMYNATNGFDAAQTAHPVSDWHYTPSTHMFYLEPSSAAYESAWTRDNIYRQVITLFFVGW